LGNVVDKPASLSCILSGFPIDEKYLGVVSICVHARHSSLPIYDRYTNEDETTKQTLGMVRDMTFDALELVNKLIL
jgi:hypothetical protein